VPVGSWTSGTLWLVEVLAALTSFVRLEDKERYDGGWLGSLAAPVDRSAVFFARVIGNLLFVFAVEVVTVPLYFWCWAYIHHLTHFVSVRACLGDFRIRGNGHVSYSGCGSKQLA